MNSKTSSLDGKQNSTDGSSKVNDSLLEEFFANELKEDTYWAEKHVGKTLPKMQIAIFLKKRSQKKQGYELLTSIAENNVNYEAAKEESE